MWQGHTICERRQTIANLHQVDKLELDCPCHRSAAFVSHSLLYSRQRGQSKQEQTSQH